MSYKDLYSEVKRRKMEALDKKKVVKAVEKHGALLILDGKYEKAYEIYEHIYASRKDLLSGEDIKKIEDMELGQYDLILIGCPGTDVPSGSFSKLEQFVINGGWLLSTDWVITSILKEAFPGYIAPSERRTDDAVVTCQIMEPNHPFLEGVVGEFRESKWKQINAKENLKSEEFRWWLEYRSFPIKILNYNAVRVLIQSRELEEKWGESPVLVYFDYGNNGGRVIHMISHSHLQKGEEKGKYASALILTNIIDEKVAQRMGISRPEPPKYVADWENSRTSDGMASHTSRPALEEQWVLPDEDNEAKEEEYLTPDLGSGGSMTETSHILEVSPDNLVTEKCAYCSYGFDNYNSKLFVCKECGAIYHEGCLNIQINEGICTKCKRILLW